MLMEGHFVFPLVQLALGQFLGRFSQEGPKPLEKFLRFRRNCLVAQLGDAGIFQRRPLFIPRHGLQIFDHANDDRRGDLRRPCLDLE